MSSDGSGPPSKRSIHGWSLYDRPGQFMMIDKAKLNIDHTYQRDKVNAARVGKIAADFSWICFGVAIVARRPDGTFWLVDAQHRKLGADKRDDIQLLPCMVFDTDDVSMEAAAFEKLNSERGNPGPLERFKALLRAGDPSATAINRLAVEFGYRPQSGGGDWTFGAVSMLQREWELDKENARVAFQLCADICSGAMMQVELFGAIAYLERFLRRHRAGSLLEAKNRLALVNAGQELIIKKIREAKTYLNKGGQRVWAEGLCNLLNHKRRNRLPTPMGNDHSPPKNSGDQDEPEM